MGIGKILKDNQLAARKEHISALSDAKSVEAPISNEADPAAEIEAKIAAAYAEGYKKAEKEFLKKREEIEARFNALKQSVEEQLSKAYDKIEDELVELALKIAEKIIEGELSFRKDIAQKVVKKALETLADPTGAKIRINPEDIAHITETFTDKEGAPLKVIPDAAIPKGGCIIETPSGRVDALLSTQFEEIRRQIQHGKS